jgi:ParB family transcriptional regulator, chromosome partitioning protein
MNKKASRRVLGRGLSALIPTGNEEIQTATENEVVNINFSAITPNQFQPRKEFNKEEIESLSQSISTHGLLQPVLVRQKSADSYEIISGERRFRALRALGRETIPCVIRQNVSDREITEMALVENIQREDLNDIEKADAFQQLILNHDYSHEQLAKQIGKSRTTITNTLRLLNLPEEIKTMIRERKISMGHARALLAIEDNDRRIILANKIIHENLSVRDVEKETQTQNGHETKKHKKQEILDPNIAETVNKLQYKLGTPVELKMKKGDCGILKIEFYSEKDLVRIVELLLS